MIDVAEQINSVRRSVGSRVFEAGEARTVTLATTYAAGIDDLWDACTNRDRIPLWFLPVSGELHVGGRYQLEGQAGGVIERCDPPNGFTATWEYGDTVSWIELRLTAEPGGATRFELEHIARADDATWAQFGPGAVGVGWDLALVGLGLHLASGERVDPAAFQAWSTSDDGLRFARLSSQSWGDAHVASGEDATTAREAARRTAEAYTATEPAGGDRA